jgi:hypothetical protein
MHKRPKLCTDIVIARVLCGKRKRSHSSLLSVRIIALSFRKYHKVRIDLLAHLLAYLCNSVLNRPACTLNTDVKFVHWYYLDSSYNFVYALVEFENLSITIIVIFSNHHFLYIIQFFH